LLGELRQLKNVIEELMDKKGEELQNSQRFEGISHRRKFPRAISLWHLL
jgi:hypothetical protein